MRKHFNQLGDEQKKLERNAPHVFMKGNLPIVIRLDGKKFSKWTKGLEYPYDENFQRLRVATLKYVMEQTHAIAGYCQSDEFTFILHQSNLSADLYLGGRKSKIETIFTSLLTGFFNANVSKYLPVKEGHLAAFDARAYQTPSLESAVESLIWREMDCTKNSIQMYARSFISHNDMIGKNRNQQLDMIIAKGENWNNCPQWFKTGTYVVPKTVFRKLSADTISSLAKKGIDFNPNAKYQRKDLVIGDFAPLQKQEHPIDCIFNDD